MSSIVLFSRCQLTDLYGSMNQNMSSEHNLIHIAYSDYEEAILKNKYEIKEVINFKNEIGNLLKVVEYDEILINEIDNLFIKTTDGRFCLNGGIQTDRTFVYLEYSDCIKLTIAYYKFWENIFKKYNIKYIIHEPPSLMFNHLASILCVKNNALYVTHIDAYGENKDDHYWIMLSGDDCKSDELDYFLVKNDSLTNQDIKRSKEFIETFRKKSGVFLSKYSKSNFGLVSLLRFNVKTIARSVKNNVKALFSKKMNPLIDAVEIFQLRSYSIIEELKKQWSNFLYCKYDDFDISKKYFYYPIHFEPEAVVLYWGDAIYKNQVKLIENIAGQLPPNTFLYVKDHPHISYYRHLNDYLKICAIPNVKLLKPSIPGIMIIKNSIGVVTINGTSGLEALLLNKHVFTFGNIFYNSYKRVKHIKNIRDLRESLYLCRNIQLKDDDDLIKFVDSYLKSIHSGFIGFFGKQAEIYNIDIAQNASIVVNGTNDFLKRVMIEKI